MGRNSSLQGWWALLLLKRAKNSVQLLASLLEVSTRTLGRWGSGEIELPEKRHRIQIRKVAGEDLLNTKGCPTYLRTRAKQLEKLKAQDPQ